VVVVVVVVLRATIEAMNRVYVHFLNRFEKSKSLGVDFVVGVVDGID
jgi:hypothetical protein